MARWPIIEFVRIVSETQAKYFVFENVKGLTVGKHKKFLDELIEEFEHRGYRVNKEWQVLNAKNFGVPQSRERLILVGARDGLPLPSYPEPLSSFPTCEEALSDIPDAERYEGLIKHDSVKVRNWTAESDFAREMRGLSNHSWHKGYAREWDPSLLTSSMRTNHSEISRRRFKETDQGTVEPISRFFKLAANGVSNTLRAGTDSARGAFTSPRPIHYKHARCVTVREMARLHGFPDWFRFHATKWHGARQIGNAVPPPLARAVAIELVGVLGGTKTPSRTLSLGDQSLLTMNMAQASGYFGVAVPIGRRDRKSGAKKRKQEEVEEARLAAKVANG